MPSPRPPLQPLLDAQQTALKEWAVVVRALEEGRQSVLLRKGGIIEETRDFSLVRERFLLFPTFEHQDVASVQEPYRRWFQETVDARGATDVVRIASWAEVTDLFLTHDLNAMLRIADLYAWSEDYIRMRMAYKPRKPMNIVLVRAYTLPHAVDVPVLEHFAGCKSWVPLDETVSLDGSEPAITDDEHSARAADLAARLGADAQRAGPES